MVEEELDIPNNIAAYYATVLLFVRTPNAEIDMKLREKAIYELAYLDEILDGVY